MRNAKTFLFLYFLSHSDNIVAWWERFLVDKSKIPKKGLVLSPYREVKWYIQTHQNPSVFVSNRVSALKIRIA